MTQQAIPARVCPHCRDQFVPPKDSHVYCGFMCGWRARKPQREKERMEQIRAQPLTPDQIEELDTWVAIRPGWPDDILNNLRQAFTELKLYREAESPLPEPPDKP